MLYANTKPSSERAHQEKYLRIRYWVRLTGRADIWIQLTSQGDYLHDVYSFWGALNKAGYMNERTVSPESRRARRHVVHSILNSERRAQEGFLRNRGWTQAGSAWSKDDESCLLQAALEWELLNSEPDEKPFTFFEATPTPEEVERQRLRERRWERNA